MKWYQHDPTDFVLKVKRHELPLVYVFATRDFSYIKIGKTKSVKQRLSNIQSGCPFHLHLWAGIRTPKSNEIEMYLHQLFEAQNVRGEWFFLTPLQLDELHEFIDLTNKNVREAIRALL